jgi:hypothetical protein
MRIHADPWFLSSRKYDPGCSSRIPDPDADFLPIPDPGSRGQKGTGSRIRIRNTGHFNADPDLAFHFDADLDRAFSFKADPDPINNSDADPDPTTYSLRCGFGSGF